MRPTTQLPAVTMLYDPYMYEQELEMDRELTPGEGIELVIELSELGMELSDAAERCDRIRSS